MFLFLILSTFGLAIPFCNGGPDSGPSGDDDDDDGPGELDISICQPENGPFTLEIDNKYLPFEVGAVNVLEGQPAGAQEGKIQLTILDETRKIAGVKTRVVEKRDLPDTGMIYYDGPKLTSTTY